MEDTGVSMEKVLYHRSRADVRTQLTLQIIDAIASIHRHKYVHGDISTKNITVKSEVLIPHENGEYFLPRKLPPNSITMIDLGFCHREGEDYNTLFVTPAYGAPECYGNEEDNYTASTASDIFALGILLYEMWFYAGVVERPSPLELIRRVPTHSSIQLMAYMIAEYSHGYEQTAQRNRLFPNYDPLAQLFFKALHPEAEQRPNILEFREGFLAAIKARKRNL